jgi:Holliday junction resolvase-like predicted endonuclease
LQYYLQNTKESTFHEIRMDAVFIKNNKIVEIYEDITNT